MKKNKIWIGIITYLAGAYASKAVGSYYGVNARAAFSYAAFVVLVLLIGYNLFKKNYLETVKLFSVVLPLGVLVIGVSLDNFYLALCGAGLFLITIPIMIKVNAKHRNDR